MRAWIHAEEKQAPNSPALPTLRLRCRSLTCSTFSSTLYPREEMQGGKKHHPNAAQHQQPGWTGAPRCHAARHARTPHMSGAPGIRLWIPHMGQPGMYAAHAGAKSSSRLRCGRGANLPAACWPDGQPVHGIAMRMPCRNKVISHLLKTLEAQLTDMSSLRNRKRCDP